MGGSRHCNSPLSSDPLFLFGLVLPLWACWWTEKCCWLKCSCVNDCCCNKCALLTTSASLGEHLYRCSLSHNKIKLNAVPCCTENHLWAFAFWWSVNRTGQQGSSFCLTMNHGFIFTEINFARYTWLLTWSMPIYSCLRAPHRGMSLLLHMGTNIWAHLSPRSVRRTFHFQTMSLQRIKSLKCLCCSLPHIKLVISPQLEATKQPVYEPSTIGGELLARGNWRWGH